MAIEEAFPLQTSQPIITTTTYLSLALIFLILSSAYFISLRYLPRTAPTKTRILFVWHAFDAIIHTVIEGSFLFQCFFTSYELPKIVETTTKSAGGWFNFGRDATTASLKSSASSLTSVAGSKITSAASAVSSAVVSKPTFTPLNLYPSGIHFLNDSTRVYGPHYGSTPFAYLWQEYARADARWGGADLTVVSLELLTVLIGAPLAAYICYMLVKGYGRPGMEGAGSRKRVWFWMSLLATGELYGGFMTFAPEWLSGNKNLDGSNFMYMWVYLFFFNMLWVWFPGWILYEAYGFFTRELVTHEEMVDLVSHLEKKNT